MISCHGEGGALDGGLGTFSPESRMLPFQNQVLQKATANEQLQEHKPLQ
jgi:hypothetical protein